MSKLSYRMVIDWSHEDKCYLVHFPDFPEQFYRTHGNSYEEAAKNGKEVLELLLEEDGSPVPKHVIKHFSPYSSQPSVVNNARKLFNREAETLKQLGTHPQIPELLGYFYFEEENKFYLIQEYIEGNTLEEELKSKPKFSEPEALAILSELLSILQFVHEKGTLHGDIKPSNIIRQKSDNKLVLINFGAVEEVINQGNLGIRIGTVGYMPPEQARGKPKSNSDIYAVGMVVIQALTGIHPTQLPEAPHTGEIIWRDGVEQINPNLAAVLDKMVSQDCKQRYQSVQEVVAALELLISPSIRLKYEIINDKTIDRCVSHSNIKSKNVCYK